MRELFPVDSESTETSLVLRTEDGEEFFLSITDELREALQGEQEETPEEEPAAPAISLAKPTKPNRWKRQRSARRRSKTASAPAPPRRSWRKKWA